jgi:hypothetical protein
MRILTAAMATSLLLTTSILAQAQEAGTPAFHLGLRTGYSLPMGMAQSADTAAGIGEVVLSELTSGAVPLVLDMGYRVIPNLMLGLYGQYGYVLLKENDNGCPSGADCSAAQYRFGIEGRYDLTPEKSLRPWFGLGIGYEILRGSGSFSGFEFSRSYSGIELVNVQAGVDFSLSKNMALGPYAQLAIGRFSDRESDDPLGGTSQDVDGTHEWLTLGVAVSTDL